MYRPIVIAVTLAAHAAYCAAAPELACPQSIQEQSVKLVNTPSGWSTFVAAPLFLHGAEPMSGPPEELGELADFEERHVKGAVIYTYKLDGKFPAGKWLACLYGEGDQVKLGKRLADSVRVCSFTYRKGEHVGENKVAIKCE